MNPKNNIRSNKTRINRKNLALTYPQCEVSKEDMLCHLRSLWNDHDIAYILISREKHADEGHHLHCFVQLKYAVNIKSLSFFDYQIKENINHADVEECRSLTNWINYVKKDGEWIEWGTNPVVSAKLTREELNKKIIAEDLDKLVDTGIIALKDLPRIIAAKESYKSLQPKSKRRNVQIIWYHGSTGTGKTRKALDEAGNEDFWISGENLKWFDGYNGQSCAIIDDLRADSCAWGFLLRLLDIYPLQVPIKGGFANWCPSKIIITAPVLPEELFINHASGQTWDKIDQLKRRINSIRCFDTDPYNPTPSQSEEEDDSETIYKATESAPQIAEEEPSHISNVDNEWDDLLVAMKETNAIDNEIEEELKIAREEREREERLKVLARKLPSLWNENYEPEVSTILKPTFDTEVLNDGFITRGNI